MIAAVEAHLPPPLRHSLCSACSCSARRAARRRATRSCPASSAFWSPPKAPTRSAQFSRCGGGAPVPCRACATAPSLERGGSSKAQDRARRSRSAPGPFKTSAHGLAWLATLWFPLATQHPLTPFPPASFVPQASNQLQAVLEEQPAFLAFGKLRDYQLVGVSWLSYSWVNDVNTILVRGGRQRRACTSRRLVTWAPCAQTTAPLGSAKKQCCAPAADVPHRLTP
jgi:hypothetical protein